MCFFGMLMRRSEFEKEDELPVYERLGEVRELAITNSQFVDISGIRYKP